MADDYSWMRLSIVCQRTIHNNLTVHYTPLAGLRVSKASFPALISASRCLGTHAVQPCVRCIICIPANHGVATTIVSRWQRRIGKKDLFCRFPGGSPANPFRITIAAGYFIAVCRHSCVRAYAIHHIDQPLFKGCATCPYPAI
jgi:hypothetical protein